MSTIPSYEQIQEEMTDGLSNYLAESFHTIDMEQSIEVTV